MTRRTVLATDGVSEAGLVPLTQDDRFEVVSVADSASEAFVATLAGAEALIVRSATEVGPEIMELAPGLRAIGRAGVGVDNIDLVAATDRGIAVFNAPGGNTVAAAELTMALMLSLVRRVTEADRSVRDGNWQRALFRGVELKGRTLGLIGAGRIGSEVSRRAQVFGMKILAHDPYLSQERIVQLGVTVAGLDEVVRRSDVISLHVPLTSETEKLIGEAELSRMRPGAFLINASRGGVIEEQALAEALSAGRLAGAALDVFEREPLPADSPLRTAPNLILTPHLGASTVEAQVGVAREVAESIKAALLHGERGPALNAAQLV